MSEEGEEGGQPQSVDITSLEIDQLLGFFIGVLAGKAWQYMGVRLAPGKDEVEKNLKKAASAIDCAAYLSQKVSPYLPPEEADRLMAMIADLQINYAKMA